MAEVLAPGTNLDYFRLDAEYVVTDPTSTPDDLPVAGYFVRIENRKSSVSSRRYTQQIAYNVQNGQEYFRAHFTDVWTTWLPRASGSLDGATLVALIDDYLGGDTWQQGTDLGYANRTDTTLDITSSTGASVTVPNASNTEAGLLTAEGAAALEDLAPIATNGLNNIRETFSAGIDAVGGHRVVAIDKLTSAARHLDPSTLVDTESVTGVSVNAASAFDPVKVVLSGLVTHTWTGAAGDAAWVDLNGDIAFGTPPTGLAFNMQIGCLLTTTVLLVRPGPAIIAA